MKKLIPLLAVAGAAAAYAIYKLKKENEKKIIDLDEELLLDEEDDDEIKIFDLSDKIEEEASAIEEVQPVEAELQESVEAILEEEPAVEAAAETVAEASEEVQEAVEETTEAETDEYDEVFTNLKKNDILAKKNDAVERLQAFEEAGDVLENDRPIYHTIRFQNAEDMEGFRREVINKGYVISKGDQEYELIVLHILPLNLVKLMAHVYHLADTAKAYHGEYLDWKTAMKN